MNQIVQLGGSTLEDADAIDDWATLAAIMLAQPDADTALPQMNRVMWQIIDHARAIKAREEARARQCA